MNTTTTLSNQDALMAASAMVGASLGVFLVFGLVLGILTIIADWKIFTKAGEAGWKSIIPVYNLYVQAKIAWKNTAGCYVYALGLFVISLLGSFITRTQGDAAPVFSMILVVCFIAWCVLHILVMIKLSKSFGKGGGFAFGLIVFPTIFTLILGFGSAEYEGAQD